MQPSGENGLSTESAAGAIKRVRYTHDAMIDVIIANPSLSQKAIAEHFGYTEAWISRITCSDAFQARLADRKAELVDPRIVASLEERFKGLIHLGVEIIGEKLEATRNPDLALRAVEISAKALGFGAKQSNITMQQSFVVALPQKSESEAAWATAHGGIPAKALPPPVNVPLGPDLVKNNSLVGLIEVENGN